MKLQNRDGLPASILEEKRFFDLYGTGKTDTPTGWNNPDNWKYLDDIPEENAFGFAMKGSDYAFIDFDHVASDGVYIQWAIDIYKRLTQYGPTYTERSVSGTGLHMILDLGDYADDFSRESNGYNQIIVQMDPKEYEMLPKEEKEKVPKVEFFYRTQGRYIYLTGDCEQTFEVARNEDAAAIFRELLQIREEHHEKYSRSHTKGGSGLDPSEPRFTLSKRDQERIMEALPWISANSREIWITIGIALSNCGFPFEVWDEWSKWTDQRKGEACDKYDPKETPVIWRSFKNTASNYNAGTIFIHAKEAGWSDRANKGKSRNNSGESLRPSDFTDLGQAEVFVDQYGDRVRYSTATGFLVYDGKRWRENDLDAQALAHELTDRQLAEARKLRGKAEEHLMNVQEARSQMTRSALKEDPELKAAEERVKAAESYHSFVLGRRKATAVRNTLVSVQSKVQVRVEDLDADGFLLNTPGGTVDLRTGEIRPHQAGDLLTKITAVSPDRRNSELFDDFLQKITGGDPDLIRYHKEAAGMALVGKVLSENLLIAIGPGGNGKSTFYNLQRRVMGDYACGLSAETLTVNNRKNKSPEYASLRGKRLVVAAELEEGMRLDSAVVKKLCSTDPIHAEEKFKAPFDFIPQHTVLLFTNHLPKVGTNDEGTWSRLVVIPFKTKFRGQAGEIKNYSDYLFSECGGAVLQWMIEGARDFISNGGFIQKASCIEASIEVYREDNDWLKAFIEERCIIDPSGWTGAGNLYSVYRAWCDDSGEFKRSKADFKTALENAGFEWRRKTRGAIHMGLRLRYPKTSEETQMRLKML